MDTTDTKIAFDDQGVCDHCHGFKRDVLPHWHPNDHGRLVLSKLIDKIKIKGKGKAFDSIIGLSGGLDSSYLLHVVVKEFGLRPLVFHVDGGWNTDIAIQNVQNLIEGLNLDLHTEVINWKEMRDLQLSFFKSGVPHIDLPQDHAFIAALYRYAAKNDIHYILNGGNFATESVRNPISWGWYGTDLWHIHDIHKQFGSKPLKSYPISGVLYHKLYLKYIRKINVIKPLNLVPYTKKVAEDTLLKEYGWRSYPQKHFESRFTRFYEGHWLPSRFGFDTRKTQFSSLILTDQMTRDEALYKLSRPAIPQENLEHEYEFISSKLGISVEELKSYHSMPLKTYRDYRNQELLFNIGSKIYSLIEKEGSLKR